MARSKAILTCYRKGVEDGDFNSLKLWLQHRADWRDRKEITGPDGGPVELDTDTVWTVNIVEGK